MEYNILLIIGILLENWIRKLTNLGRYYILKSENFTLLKITYLIQWHINFSKTRSPKALTTYNGSVQPVDDFLDFIFAFLKNRFVWGILWTFPIRGELMCLLSVGK